MSAVLKTPPRPTVWIWLSVTLLWGTVFFVTSTWMLKAAVIITGEGVFDPGGSTAFKVFAFFVPLLVMIALVSMTVKNRLDPGSLKQISRQQAVAKGSRERIFVSFAGSIATSSLFTLLTALAYLGTASMTGYLPVLSPETILLAAALNIAAGLSASLLVGLIFILTGAFGMRRGS
jgi:hypothetical protein